MAKASRTLSHAEESANDNNIFSLWTQTWGVIVRPWYAADKLKFSFVEKGKEGKGKSFDICMDTLKDGAPCFDDWAYDILNAMRLERNLAAEAQAGEKYPKTYKYVTGENGDKTIGICNSTKGGYCINASVPDGKGSKVFANIPVSFHDLRKLAEKYELSYQPRREELEKIRRNAEKEAEKFHKNGNFDAPAPAPEQSAPEQPAPQATAPAQTGSKKMSLLSVGDVINGECKVMKSGEKGVFTLKFTQDGITAFGTENFEKFKAVASRGVTIKCEVIDQGESLVFVRPAA